MKLFKLIILFLFVFLIQKPAFCADITIDVVSDVYINSDKKENKMTESIKNLLEAVKIINKNSSDCVVFLGNNVQSASKYDIAMFSKIIDRINKPVYVTVGNKDLARSKNLEKKEYYRILNKYSKNKLKTVPSYKKIDDVVFIFLSGVNETFPSQNGYYKADELLFLDETLEKFSENKVVIFQHFPIIEPCESKTKQTIKKEEYLDVISKHKNIIAIVSGHYHIENIIEDNSIKHISIPSLKDTKEFEQIKIYEDKNGEYQVTLKVLTAY